MIDKPKKKKKDINPFLGQLVVICILIGLLLLFVFGCFIYNIPNLLSKTSLLSLVLSFVFFHIINKEFFLLDVSLVIRIRDFLLIIVIAVVIVFCLWQMCLAFITIACIPLIKRLIPLFFDIVQYAPSLGISDPTGLIGALIGGLFSIIAVRITITSTNDKNREDEINLASPRLVFSIVQNDTAKVIGNGVMVCGSEENKNNNYLSYYILNLGGDAIDIILNAGSKDQAKWLYNQRSLEAFPVLRKGEMLEVKFNKNMLNSTNTIELKYFDVFSNKYLQDHTVKPGEHGQVSTMPYRIYRDRNSSNIWKTISKRNYNGESKKEEQIDHYDYLVR